MTKFFVLLSVLFGLSANARDLAGTDSLVAFSCTLSSAVGFTNIQFDSTVDSTKVSGKRNSWIPVNYKIHSVGSYKSAYTQKEASQISLSGGSLSQNQYMTLAFRHLLQSGTSSTNGTIYLSSAGGSIFGPIGSSPVAIGSASCTVSVR